MTTPLDFDEQDLLVHLRASLPRAFPIAVGGYTATLWRESGQAEPIVYDNWLFYAVVRFEDTETERAPWTIEQRIRICERAERSVSSVSAHIEALALVIHRVMRDVRDERYRAVPFVPMPLDRAMEALLKASDRSRSTVAGCAAVLLSARELQPMLAPLQSEVDAAVVAIDAWLEERVSFVSTETFSLEVVSTSSGYPVCSPRGVAVGREGLVWTLRLVIRDPDGTIQNVKEQPILVVPAAHLSDLVRILAYLEGLATAIPLRAAQGEVAALLPSDLIDWRVLDLKRPRSAEDFVGALKRRWKVGA